MNAKAIVFPAVGKVEIRSVELPPMAEDDVLVELDSSGVSVGTERWALLGKRPPGDVTYPCIPGYLSVGRIKEVGKQAAGFGYKVGDRVNFFVAKTPQGYGGNWMTGHISPAVVNVNPANISPAWDLPYCRIVPENLPTDVASLAALGAVACRGIEMAVPAIGESVLVVGQGVIGQLAAQICRLKGATVLTADIIDQRVAISAKLGADRAINSRTENLPAVVKELYPQGVDLMIDTASSAQLVNDLIAAGLIKTGGRMVFQGWYPPPSGLNLHNLQNTLTRGVYFPSGHAGKAVAQVMRWMSQGVIQGEPLISHRFPIDRAAEAYKLVVDEPNKILGIVFDWSHS